MTTRRTRKPTGKGCCKAGDRLPVRAPGQRVPRSLCSANAIKPMSAKRCGHGVSTT